MKQLLNASAAALIPSETDVFLPQPDVQKRYGVTAMCIHRWRTKRPELGFPDGMVVNGRRYFKLSELLEWERKTAARVGSHLSQPTISKNGKRVGRPPKQRPAAGSP